MKSLFSIFSLLLVSLCDTSNTPSSQNLKMVLTLNSDTVSFSDSTLVISLDISNESDKDIYILDFPEFSTENHSVYQIVIKKGEKQKISPKGVLGKKRIPERNDYQKLSPGETLSYTYELDMITLVDSYDDLGKLNQDFGAYTIQLFFKDNFQINKSAIKTLNSNTLELNYIP